MTLFTLAIFVIGIWLLSFYASQKLRQDTYRQLGEQQVATATFMATHINDELSERLSDLEKLAERITPDTLQNTSALQALLEDQLIITRDFNAGAYIVDTHGTAIAAIPSSIKRVGVNFMERDHITSALIDGKSRISKPVIGKVLNSPIFSIGAPIRDRQGKVIGALAGVVDLGEPNFLDKFTKTRYGKAGYYLLEEPKNRLIITGTDKRRIMQKLPPPGVNKLIDHHVAGYEETGITINPLGVEVLASAKHIPVAGWFIVAALPTAEAFAPIHDLQQNIMKATLLLTLLAGVMTWWLLRRQLSPMLDTAKNLAILAKSDQQPQPLPNCSANEISEMISSFNYLLETLRKREEALQESEYRWKFAIEGSGDGLWDWDVPTNTVFYSKTWKAMLGYSEEEIGNGLDEWEKRVHPDDKAEALTAVQNHLDGKTPVYISEHRVLCKDGSYKWILDRGLVVRRSEDGKPLRAIGTHTDITPRKQMELQIRQQAFYDPLTRLPNRRLLIDRMSQVMAASKRSGDYSALVFLDLDNFKPLNDTHGHAVGDLLLIEVANRLKACIREMDTVARLGGDEFVVMLAQLDMEKAVSRYQAEIVAEKIRLALAEPYILQICDDRGEISTVEHHCTASIGVVLFLNHESSQDDIVKWADAAMYQAKDSGRNQIRFYDENS